MQPSCQGKDRIGQFLIVSLLKLLKLHLILVFQDKFTLCICSLLLLNHYCLADPPVDHTGQVTPREVDKTQQLEDRNEEEYTEELVITKELNLIYGGVRNKPDRLRGRDPASDPRSLSTHLSIKKVTEEVTSYDTKVE